MLKSSKHVFLPHEINELKLNFSDKIYFESISMTAVQEKQKLLKCSSLSTRQIYDKLRQVIKERRHVGGPVDKLNQKIERMDDALSCSSDSDPNFILVLTTVIQILFLQAFHPTVEKMKNF